MSHSWLVRVTDIDYCLWRTQTLPKLWKKKKYGHHRSHYMLTRLYPNMWLWITWASIPTGNLTTCGFFSEILRKSPKWIALDSLDSQNIFDRVQGNVTTRNNPTANTSELCSINWLTWFVNTACNCLQPLHRYQDNLR